MSTSRNSKAGLISPTAKSKLAEDAAYLHGQGWSFSEIAKRLGTTKDRVQKIVKQHEFRESAPEPMPAELEIQGNSFVILGDLHANYIDWKVAREALNTAKRLRIKQVAIVGDLFNLDALSRWPITYRSEGFRKELAQARALMEAISGVAKTVYWCRGNHDYRMSVATQGQLDMDELATMISPGSKLEIFPTIYDRMWIHASTGKWLLVHPHQYSRDPLKVARSFALKYQCHTVVAHQHHHAVGTSADGRWVCADLPCACIDIPYKAANTNSLPEWARGFGLLYKGEYFSWSTNHPMGFMPS